MTKFFSRQDVLEINEKVRSKAQGDRSSLSSTSKKIVQGTSFSTQDINIAFKEARRRLADVK